MDWLPVALEEYKTLRLESIEALKGQHSTLRVGTAAVGVVLASGFNLWDKTLLPDLIFLLFNPALCYIVLAVWIGEVARMMRAGSFLAGLEKKISAAFPDKPDVLSWENWLRSSSEENKTPQIKWNYLSIIALFFATALASIAIGNYRIWGKLSPTLIYILNGIELIFFLIALVSILRLGRKVQIIQFKPKLRLTGG